MKLQLIILIALTGFAGCSQEQDQRPSTMADKEQVNPILVSIHDGYTMPALLEQTYQVNKAAELDPLLTQKWYAEFTVIDITQPEISLTISTCNDYLAHQTKQLNTQQERDNSAFMEIAVMCQATDKLIKSTSAKTSYLDDLKFDEKLPEKLPAEVAMVISESERARILSDNTIKTWSQATNIIGYEKSGSDHAVYRTDGGAQELNLVARGDFNQDGFEDMMMTSRDSVSEGSYSAVRLFILTRKTKDGAVQIIK